MSRRASLLAKQEKRKPRVRFPDELVFLDNMKGNDIQACHSMLRRASVQMDINGLDSNGLSPLHNAVLEGNLAAVRLLVQHGADVNRKDSDLWTPLHAACANSEADIARYLLSKGASKDIKTGDGERPLDLCDARDFSIISVMLESDTARKARLLSAPDEELEFGEYNNNDDTREEDDEDKTSQKLGSRSGSAESSPETFRRTAHHRNGSKNTNADLGSQTSSLVTGINNLKTGQGGTGTSPSKLAVPASNPHRSPSSGTSRNLSPNQSNSPAVSRPPKAIGQSILKKSPQQFRTVAE